MDSLVTLFDETPAPPSPVLLPELQTIYGGDLAFPQLMAQPAVPPLSLHQDGKGGRAVCYANFVTTLDGIVSFNLPKQDTGNAISGGSVIDHAVMGILRAVSDAIIWGNATYQAARRFLPTAEAIWPAGADLLRAQRASMGKPAYPTAVIVSASGQVDTSGALFRQAEQPAIIATTDVGTVRLGTTPSHVAIWRFGAVVTPLDLLRRLREERGIGMALCEGGAALLGSFLAAGAMDEIFLTRAPQFAGRAPGSPRSGLVEGVAFLPTTAPWATLRSLKRSGSFLFERYALIRS